MPFLYYIITCRLISIWTGIQWSKPWSGVNFDKYDSQNKSLEKFREGTTKTKWNKKFYNLIKDFNFNFQLPYSQREIINYKPSITDKSLQSLNVLKVKEIFHLLDIWHIFSKKIQNVIQDGILIFSASFEGWFL